MLAVSIFEGTWSLRGNDHAARRARRRAHGSQGFPHERDRKPGAFSRKTTATQGARRVGRGEAASRATRATTDRTVRAGARTATRTKSAALRLLDQRSDFLSVSPGKGAAPRATEGRVRAVIHESPAIISGPQPAPAATPNPERRPRDEPVALENRQGYKSSTVVRTSARCERGEWWMLGPKARKDNVFYMIVGLVAATRGRSTRRQGPQHDRCPAARGSAFRTSRRKNSYSQAPVEGASRRFSNCRAPPRRKSAAPGRTAYGAQYRPSAQAHGTVAFRRRAQAPGNRPGAGHQARVYPAG